MSCTVIDIRGNKKNKLKNMLIYLYLLNISDLIFTKYLLKVAPDLFKEVNIFLEPMISGYGPYFLKIGLMAAILIYWYIRSEKSNIKQINRSMKVSKILLGFYILINIMHVINIGIYLYAS